MSSPRSKPAKKTAPKSTKAKTTQAAKRRTVRPKPAASAKAALKVAPVLDHEVIIVGTGFGGMGVADRKSVV